MPVAGSYARTAWFTVSATAIRPSGSGASPCGSLNASGPNPRSPLPIRRTTLSPSAASSTSWWRVESETRKFPEGSASTLPGKRRSVATGSGATYGPSPRRRVPFAACAASSSSTSFSMACACPSPACWATTYPSGSMTTSVGQARTAYCFQVASSGSSRTGWWTSYRSTASTTAACSASWTNFGEWTPTTTTVSLCFCSSSRNSSRTCRQLMQQKVQKSSRTIRPRRSARVYWRPPVLSQPPLPISSGARTRARRRGVGVADGAASFMPQACHPGMTAGSHTLSGRCDR